MAGMFYSLDEVMEKLSKGEDDIKNLIMEGKLREFRDGPKQLYKVEDVDALAGAPADDLSVMDDSLEFSIDETGEISLAPEELAALSDDTSGEVDAGTPSIKLDETGELPTDEITLDASGDGEVSLAPDDSGDVSFDTDMLGDDVKLDSNQNDAIDEEITLDAGESDMLDVPAESQATTEDVAAEDTALAASAGETINVLADSDPGYKLSDDTSGETKLMDTGGGSLDDGDLSIERLDDDVNLDGFGGSGSGLLDLSLQADDTSLGAVLDDIYPESGAAGAGAMENALDQSPMGGGMPAEHDNAFADTLPADGQGAGIMSDAAPEVASAMPAMGAAVRYAAEPEPDSASNMFGVMLFLPLIAVIYAGIVVVSAGRPIQDLKIVSPIENILWYIIGGMAGVVLLMSIMGAVMGGDSSSKPAKAKMPKAKKEKPQKAKKPKKAKKAKKGKKGADDYQE